MLRAAAASVGVAAGLFAGSDDAAARSITDVTVRRRGAANGWRAVDSPTSKPLYAVEAAADGAYACGDSGVLLRRGADGWAVLDGDGPRGKNKTLYGLGVTDDGGGVWSVGASGTVGEYRVDAGTARDHSTPNGYASTLTAVDVVGAVGDERVYAASGSGELLCGVRGDDGSLTWTVLDTGGATTVNGVDFHTRDAGRVVTTAARVFETTDGGDSWTQVGIADAQNSMNAVVSGPDRIYAGGGNGRVWRQDCTCRLWTPTKPAAKSFLALERDGRYLLGAGESGYVYERTGEEAAWTNTVVGAGSDLHGCVIGSGGDPDVVVGNGGEIFER